MADNLHKLAIFRGLLKFRSNVQKIWGVLIFLSIVTTIEVVLGILKPEFLLSYFLNMKLLNWIFIILTLVKAYYIAWDFMMVEFDNTSITEMEKCVTRHLKKWLKLAKCADPSILFRNEFGLNIEETYEWCENQHEGMFAYNGT